MLNIGFYYFPQDWNQEVPMQLLKSVPLGLSHIMNFQSSITFFPHSSLTFYSNLKNTVLTKVVYKETISL